MPESAPAPAPKPAPPPPRAPGLGELFEQSLAAAVNPGVFRAAAARPAPSFGAAGGLALASGAAALAVNLAHAAVASPDLLSRFPPALVLAVGAAALGLYASVQLLLAVMLYGLGNALGGKGDFDRGLQASAMLSVLWPAQMLCNWFPIAWVLPAVLGAWIAACALEGLFGAGAPAARALCAVLAGAAIGLQAAGRMVADRARQAYAVSSAMAPAADGGAELAKQMEALQQQAAQAALAMPAAPSAPPAGAATSGLDLLKGPVDAADAGAPPQAAPPPPEAAVAAARTAQAGAAGMLDALTPMLSNPAMSRNMSPQQKADMKELQGLIADLKAQIASGRSASDAVFAQRMTRLQQLSVRMMAAGLQAPGAAAPAADRSKPRLKFDEGGR